jgi:hypothetical protein
MNQEQAPGSERQAARSRKGPATIETLVAEMHDIADRLLRDGASRGDVKILGRALKELRYAFKVFAPYRGRRKVTVFGSARCLPTSSPYRQAVDFGRLMTHSGWMVITGASSGIMEAAHVGAGREHSMGVNILLPFEQGSNPVIAGDSKLIHLKYFFTRKLLFVKESDAVVLFPGGFGTMDEAFEVLTLLQTGKHELIPVVLVEAPGDDYWARWLYYVRESLLAKQYISDYDLSLFCITDQPGTAVSEILQFYRVYHSMRYVGDRLVLRLLRRISHGLVERLNDEYGGILASGRIEQGHALPEEADDTAIASLPRITLHFDRKSFGLLRRMIDLINAADVEQ